MNATSLDSLKSAKVPEQTLIEGVANYGRLINTVMNIAITPVWEPKEKLENIKLDDCIGFFNSFRQYGGGQNMYDKLSQNKALFTDKEVQDLLRQLVGNFDFISDFTLDVSFNNSLMFMGGPDVKNKAIEDRQQDPQLLQAKKDNYVLWNTLYTKVFGVSFPGAERVLNSYVKPITPQFGIMFDSNTTRGF